MVNEEVSYVRGEERLEIIILNKASLFNGGKTGFHLDLIDAM